MSRRATGGRIRLPVGMQQVAVRQSHQDRVERAGPEPDLLAEFVAVTPGGRLGGQGAQDGLGLRRERAGSQHLISLHRSSYWCKAPARASDADSWQRAVESNP